MIAVAAILAYLLWHWSLILFADQWCEVIGDRAWNLAMLVATGLTLVLMATSAIGVLWWAIS